MIIRDETRGIFVLSTTETSYALGLVEGALPVHLHWGARLSSPAGLTLPDSPRRPFSVQTPVGSGEANLDGCPAEYGFAGSGDFRTPAWAAIDSMSYPILEAWHESHTVHAGKPDLAGLPSVRTASGDGAETLELVLRDGPSSLEIHLFYTVLPEFDVITRSATFVNSGREPIRLSRAASLCVDMPNRGYEMVSLCGAWGREADLIRHPLAVGAHSIGSRRGISSHHANPFLAIAESSATEHHGEIRAAALVYSGDFLAQVERSSDDQLRLLLGINPETFSWLLAPGERFTTPEAILVYTESGFNGMSQRFHAIIRERLMRSRFRDRPRPILVNNWEATHFSFTHDSLLPIVDAAAGMGIELFVLDDGWFGNRDDDRTSLGDWSVNRRKIPRGLEGLAEEVTRRGLRFGLWFEPEMVSPESELFRAHPDWCLHVPGRGRPTGRNQLVLDFSRAEVCDEIIRRLRAVLDSAPVSYVKWDMNRYLTHVASPSLPAERRQETAHRYVLGLYRVMDELTSRHPEILFAGCSGGGGRFDAGILAYMPQIWASDDTDAVARLRIQYGLSLVYPISSIEAHVTDVPNHQVGRVTPFATRGEVAISANFGFELDLARLGESERRQAAEMVAFYKEHRDLIQQGAFWRLESPFEGDGSAAAWMFTEEGGKKALVFAFQILNVANRAPRFLRLVALDPQGRYRVEGSEDEHTGAELMGRGLRLPLAAGDFAAYRCTLRAM